MIQKNNVMDSIPKMQNLMHPSAYTPVRKSFNDQINQEQLGDINWDQSENWEPVVIRQDGKSRMPKQAQTLFESFDKAVRDGTHLIYRGFSYLTIRIRSATVGGEKGSGCTAVSA